MGKLLMPVLSDEELQLKQLPKSRAALFKSMQAMAGQGLFSTSTPGMGMPLVGGTRKGAVRGQSGRSRGDTHNAWAFNLRDEQKNVGVEVGTLE